MVGESQYRTLAAMDEQADFAFIEAFNSGGSSDCVTCTCGRIHVNLEEYASALNESEGRTLRERVAEDRKSGAGRYVVTEAPPLVLDVGVHLVMGCPCGGDAKYSWWLWTHRRAVVAYLKTRSDRETAEAESFNAEVSACSATCK